MNIMETTTDALATPVEMAALYKVSRETIYHWLQEGQVPGAFKVGGTWRVSLAVWHEAMSRVPAA